MTNTQNNTKQMKNYSSKITVLVCVTRFESYAAAVLNPSLFKSLFYHSLVSLVE